MKKNYFDLVYDNMRVRGKVLFPLGLKRKNRMFEIQG